MEENIYYYDDNNTLISRREWFKQNDFREGESPVFINIPNWRWDKINSDSIDMDKIHSFMKRAIFGCKRFKVIQDADDGIHLRIDNGDFKIYSHDQPPLSITMKNLNQREEFFDYALGIVKEAIKELKEKEQEWSKVYVPCLITERERVYLWTDFSWTNFEVTDISSAAFYEFDNYEHENIYVKVLKKGLSSPDTRPGERTRFCDVLVESQKTGRKYYTHSRFLAGFI